MDLALLVAQGLLAVGALFAGVVRLTRHKADLIVRAPYLAPLPSGAVKLIGVIDLVAAAALAAPLALDVPPDLGFLGAVLLIVAMLIVATISVGRQRLRVVPVNLTLLALAAFVAWGMWPS